VVAELVSRAYGGPPWWTVSDADTTVYILGSPGSVPRGVNFDRTILDKRLTGAHGLILGPNYRQPPPMQLRSAYDRLIRMVAKNSKTDLEPSLPPALRARFAAARQKIGQPETRYGGLTPGLAGMALAGDAMVALQATAPPGPPMTPVDQIVVQAARKKRVRVSTAITYDGFWKALPDLEKPGTACLEAMLDSLEDMKVTPPGVIAEGERALRAWAEGDAMPFLDFLRANPPARFGMHRHRSRKGAVNLILSSRPCINALPAYAREQANPAADQAAAIKRALGKKGHAVAVVGLGTLTSQGGVLDQLRREGFTIVTPSGAS